MASRVKRAVLLSCALGLVFAASGFSESGASVRIGLKTVPTGAAVTVDGKAVGVSPLRDIALPAGEHAFTFSAPGYRPESLISAVTDGASVFMKLVPTNSFHRFRERVRCGAAPKECIFSPDGRYLLVTLMEGDGVEVYDLSERKIVKRLRPAERAAEKGFVEGVFSPDGGEFWFAQLYPGLVHVVSWPSMEWKAVVKNVGKWPKVVEFSPDGAFVYASNWSGNDITVIDAKTFRIVRRFAVPGRAPRNMAFSPLERALYVTCFESGEVLKMDPENGELLRRIKTGGAPDRIRLSPGGKTMLFNDTGTARIYELDLATDRIVRETVTWIKPNNCRISPDGRFIYAPCRGPNSPLGYDYPCPEDGKMFVIDRATFRTADVFRTGNQPVGCNLSPDGKLLAFCNLQECTFEIFEVMGTGTNR